MLFIFLLEGKVDELRLLFEGVLVRLWLVGGWESECCDKVGVRVDVVKDELVGIFC